jgi:hypothetical protein
VAAEVVRVFGLRELRAALKRTEDRAPKELQLANKRAADLVAREAQRRAPRGPHQGGGNVQPVAASIRSQATTGKAVVAFGGRRSPHAPPLEFGGTLRRFHSASRTRVQKRPFVYPAIEAERDHVLEQYERALIAITSDL